jgi:hypothetical protein
LPRTPQNARRWSRSWKSSSPSRSRRRNDHEAKSIKAVAKAPAKKKPAEAGALGVLPDSELKQIVKAGAVFAEGGIKPDQIQPASLDLRLGKVAYRLRASFLPGSQVVADRLDDSLVMHTLDLTRGAVLETGCVYLVPLQER